MSLIQVEGLEDHCPHSFCFHAARLISQVIVHTAWQLASHRTVFGLGTTQPDPAGRTENSTQEKQRTGQACVVSACKQLENVKPKMLRGNQEEMCCLPSYPLGISEGKYVETLAETLSRHETLIFFFFFLDGEKDYLIILSRSGL